MEERQICCCGSSGWTRVIAWFQIIGSFISIISFAFLLVASVAVLAGAADGAKRPDGTPYTPEEIQDLKAAAIAGFVGSIVMLILMILAFVMAIILLRGSVNRNPRLIHAWIVYTVTLLTIWVVRTIAECVFATSGAGRASVLMTLAFGLVIELFCLWVVMTHKEEIEASARPVFPVKA